VASIVEAQARQAVQQLHDVGLAMGPSADPEAWRREVRALARRAGLRLRTGFGPMLDDGEQRPWAVAAWYAESQVSDAERRAAIDAFTASLLPDRLTVVQESD
jgi:hypothetical protein